MMLSLIFKVKDIFDALRDLVTFVQFEKLKKIEKHPWKSVCFSKATVTLSITLPHGCISCSLNCRMAPNRVKCLIYASFIYEAEYRRRSC